MDVEPGGLQDAAIDKKLKRLVVRHEFRAQELGETPNSTNYSLVRNQPYATSGTP